MVFLEHHTYDKQFPATFPNETLASVHWHLEHCAFFVIDNLEQFTPSGMMAMHFFTHGNLRFHCTKLYCICIDFLNLNVLLLHAECHHYIALPGSATIRTIQFLCMTNNCISKHNTLVVNSTRAYI